MSTSLWPEVDRVALCIHRPSGSDPAFRAMVQRLQIPAGSFIVSAARHIAAGRVTLEQLELIARYESRSLVKLNAQRHVELGFLSDVDDGAFAPSDEFREAARSVLDVQAHAAERLWADADDVRELAALAGSVVVSVAAPVELPAFSAQRADHRSTPTSPAGQLLAFVTELRYLRSDLHAHALTERGLYGPTARAVDRLWKGHPIDDDNLERLRAKALVVQRATGWELDVAPHRARDEAQAETERLSAIALEAVADDDLERFAHRLAGLPGEDPRPPTDR